MEDDKQVRVVVVGGGFGGLTFCQQFRHAKARVTLVDRTNHHLFQPLLYQVAMAGLAAPDIAQPIRSILSRQPNLTVLLDEIVDFDLAGRRVIGRQKTLSYDYLVIALGSVTSYFGHKDWAEYAPGLKTLEDGLMMRRNVLLAFEHAENEPDPAVQTKLMTIVVVGGGPTGVELAGACTELAHRVLQRDFDHIDPRRAQVLLIEGSPRLLSHMSPELSESARQQLERLGVQVHLDRRVKNLTPGCVELDNGELIEAENILWAAGVMAHPLLKKTGLPLDRAGRIEVNPDLSVPGHPNVFAIGDIVYVQQENGLPVPGVAPAAMQMARHVARLLEDELDLAPNRISRPAFQYRDKGTLATIGRSAGVAALGRFQFSGFAAWLAWLIVHLVFLIGFRNKISVLISWTYSYLTYRLGARIITGWPETLTRQTAAEQPPAAKTGTDKNLMWR